MHPSPGYAISPPGELVNACVEGLVKDSVSTIISWQRQRFGGYGRSWVRRDSTEPSPQHPRIHRAPGFDELLDSKILPLVSTPGMYSLYWGMTQPITAREVIGRTFPADAEIMVIGAIQRPLVTIWEARKCRRWGWSKQAESCHSRLQGSTRRWKSQSWLGRAS